MTSRFPARTTSDPSISSWGKPVAGGVSYGVATGGTATSITVSSTAYTLLTMASDTNLVVSTGGIFDVLAVGGGGGGARSDQANRGGGGGGGGDIVGLDAILTVYLAAGTYAVDVGSAGGPGAYTGAVGSKTTLHSSMVVANGGGGGTGCDNAISGATQRMIKHAGGSGGGYAFNDFQFVSQGTKVNNGGYGPAGSGDSGGLPASAGGGGGAGSAGSPSTTNGVGGAGGNGANIGAWIGAGTTYASAGGGGGGTTSGGAAGNGGVAGNTTTAPTTYGSGGAGANGTAAGSAGFQGVLYVRFKV